MRGAVRGPGPPPAGRPPRWRCHPRGSPGGAAGCGRPCRTGLGCPRGRCLWLCGSARAKTSPRRRRRLWHLGDVCVGSKVRGSQYGCGQIDLLTPWQSHRASFNRRLLRQNRREHHSGNRIPLLTSCPFLLVPSAAHRERRLASHGSGVVAQNVPCKDISRHKDGPWEQDPGLQ